MISFQYNEWSILSRIFPAIDVSSPGEATTFFKRSGYIVEIGAADGIDNSNSYELIKWHGWHGLLVEPHPGYFMDLLKLYTDNPAVKLSNYAVAGTTCRRRLCLDDQCSSLVYHKPLSVEVQCVTLNKLLSLYNTPKDFDFLSVDCEGADMEVLKSLDWGVWKPTAVCVEHSMPREELDVFMDYVGYREFDRNMGNTFFVRK